MPVAPQPSQGRRDRHATAIALLESIRARPEVAPEEFGSVVGRISFFVNAGIHLGIGTIIIGQCTFLTSYVFIVVTARLAGMDRTLEHASADLGANE